MRHTRQAKYVFCVVDLPEGAAGPPPVPGVDVVRCKDIGALVEDTAVRSFDGMDRAELDRRVARHHEVNERAMEKGACVPMRFGLIGESADEVREFLHKAYLKFKTALRRVRGKAEYGLHVHWDEARDLAEIAATDDGVRSLREKLSAAPAEENEAAKIALGQAVHASLARRREAYLQEIPRRLDRWATHWSLGKLRGDSMIANFAFLIGTGEKTEFERGVKQLGQAFEGKLRFRLVGPLPPYCFSEVNLAAPAFELIDAARRTLGLGEEATLAEVKDAYRKLALSLHPDRNPALPKGAEEFQRMHEAYATLLTFCENYRYSFREEAARKVVLVDDKSAAGAFSHSGVAP